MLFLLGFYSGTFRGILYLQMGYNPHKRALLAGVPRIVRQLERLKGVILTSIEGELLPLYHSPYRCSSDGRRIVATQVGRHVETNSRLAAQTPGSKDPHRD